MRRVLPVLVFALGTALLLGACGGGGAPSKSEYIAKADAICKEGNKKSNEVGKDLSASSSAEELQAALKKAVPIVAKQLEDVRALDKPKGDEAQLNAIYDEVDNALGEIRKATETPEASLALLKSNSPFTKANELSKKYGFKECGK